MEKLHGTERGGKQILDSSGAVCRILEVLEKHQIYSFLRTKMMQPEYISETFAEHFASVFSSPQNNDHADVTNGNKTCSANHHVIVGYFSKKEVCLKKLKPKRSCGPDTIPPHIFKGCWELLVLTYPYFSLRSIDILALNLEIIDNVVISRHWRKTKIFP